MKSRNICGRVIKTVGRVKGNYSVDLSVFGVGDNNIVVSDAIDENGNTVHVRSFHQRIMGYSLDKLIDFLKKVRAEMSKR